MTPGPEQIAAEARQATSFKILVSLIDGDLGLLATKLENVVIRYNIRN